MLCENCLESGPTVKKMPVGHANGSQRDPWWYEVALCDPCRDALLASKWDVIHERFAPERTVRRDSTEEALGGEGQVTDHG